jgi:hypothetical protein
MRDLGKINIGVTNTKKIKVNLGTFKEEPVRFSSPTDTGGGTNEQKFNSVYQQFQPQVQAIIKKRLPAESKITIEVTLLSDGARNESLIKFLGVRITIAESENIPLKTLAAIQTDLNNIDFSHLVVDPKMFVCKSAGSVTLTQHRTSITGKIRLFN